MTPIAQIVGGLVVATVVFLFLIVPGTGQVDDYSRCLQALASTPTEKRASVHPEQKRADRDPCWSTSLIYHASGIDVSKRAQFLHGVAELRSAYSLSGEDVTVGVWDAGHALANHVEFGNRVILKDTFKGIHVNGHATHVVGTIGSAGINESAQGMAPIARIHSFYWGDDVGKLGNALKSGISVTNHSYGTVGGWSINDSIECPVVWHWYGRHSDEESFRYGRYDIDAANFDRVAFANPTLSMFVAAGNERQWFGEPNLLRKDQFDGRHCVWLNGKWVLTTKKRAANSRRGGYDTLVGISLAKNIITVGAMEDLPNNWTRSEIAAARFSSLGPADDGRIKPDVVANGVKILSTAPPPRCDKLNNCQLTDILATEISGYAEESGTSMASPVAAGIGALLNELALKSDGLRRLLFSDEMKAVMVHTALSPREDDGPTYRTGWGSIQALQAGNMVAGHEGVLERRTIIKNGTSIIDLEWVGHGSARITATWLDRHAAAVPEKDAVIDNRDAILVDRLEITLLSPTGAVFHPWSLDPNNPGEPPVRDKPNNVDNVNRFDVPHHKRHGGTWQLRIDAGKVVTNQVAVAIAYSGLRPIRK